MRDYQRERVYSWEDQYIHSKDKQVVPYDSLQSLVNYIWAEEKLKFPPQIKPIPKQTRRILASATRMEVFVPEQGITTSVLIHELAHSLTNSFDGEISSKHGPDFVGMYMRMLEKYARIPLPYLMFTAKQANVDFNINARVAFLD